MPPRADRLFYPAVMANSHSDVIQSAFSGQASAFEDARYNKVFTTQSEWLFERLELDREDLLLDVAAGTGHASRLLAPLVRTVVAIDATEAMLSEGRTQARKAGLQNILFMRGDAAQMPFLDGSFDVVISRFAIHHFERPDEQIAEIARCVRPGGQVALADLVADEDPQIAEIQNHLERLRDRSHTRMLSSEELAERARRAGLEVASSEVRALERPLQPWLEQAKTSERERAQILSTLHGELENGPASGFRPVKHDGELWFTQRFASVIAREPADPRG